MKGAKKRVSEALAQVREQLRKIIQFSAVRDPANCSPVFTLFNYTPFPSSFRPSRPSVFASLVKRSRVLSSRDILDKETRNFISDGH